MKTRKLLLLIATSTLLSGCDLFGGGEGKVDTTLYELKITTNLDKAKDGVSAELCRERDQDEIDELLENGASQEEINKAGTCVDGTYYFYDQDGINLYEPFIPGYEFLGWYNGNEFLGYLDTDYDGIPNFIWNMPNKNTTLEARFKLMNFNILYMDDGVGPAEYTGNPTTWNVEDGELVLNHLDKTDQGLQFDGWTFAMGGGTYYEGYVTKLDEQFLIDSNVAKIQSNGAETLTFSLHENYSQIKHDVKLTFDNTVIDYIVVDVTPIGEQTYSIYEGDDHFLRSGEVSAAIAHNAEVVVSPTLINSDDYEIDGIYYNNTKISQEVSIRGGLSTGYKIIVDRDAEVELRYRAKI